MQTLSSPIDLTRRRHRCFRFRRVGAFDIHGARSRRHGLQHLASLVLQYSALQQLNGAGGCINFYLDAKGDCKLLIDVTYHGACVNRH